MTLFPEIFDEDSLLHGYRKLTADAGELLFSTSFISYKN
jgi:hypothetical protein